MNTQTRLCVGIFVCMIVFAVTASVVSASIVTSEKYTNLSVYKDSHIEEEWKDTNYGSVNVMHVTSDSPAENERTLVQANFTSIPSGSSVLSAVLKLYMQNAPGASRTHKVYGITGSWNESGLTWRNQPNVSSVAFTNTTTGTADDVWLSWNLTSSVQSFVNGSRTNNGWEIRDSVENYSSKREAEFRSSEASSLRPYVSVIYTCDYDNDGYNRTGGCGGSDTNDYNISIHPGAVEVCNGVDDNSNGAVDEGYAVGTSCTSQANSCGDTSSGTYACSADQLGVTCPASIPEERPGYNIPCSSEANSCGDTNIGVTDCSGICSASTPGERPAYNQECVSEANSCGDTTTGKTDCNGACTASAPAERAEWNVPCTSTANSCGDTNTGVTDCSGACTAVTPSERTVWNNACASEPNSCGDTNSGFTDCSGTCLASAPAERESYGQECTSSPNSCGETASGTTDCNGVCTAITPSNPDRDDDGIADCNDNCMSAYNPDQTDVDSDLIGDACDSDNDNDSVDNAVDNCPLTYNPDQLDTNENGVGDACDYGAAEICDGRDNNGNGFVDEDMTEKFGSNVGQCQYGFKQCVNGTWNVTVPSVDPVSETCNGLDDDCSGGADNGFGLGVPCTSATNSCGDTQDGTIECDTGYSTKCSASAPPEREVWGNACSSSANSCGDTNSGSTDCSGECSASRPAERAFWNVECTSAANSCGDTSSGITDCEGACSAERPAERTAWHQSCLSEANSCGDTQEGLTDCNGRCTAETPAERSAWSLECTSTSNSCGDTSSGITGCDGLCNAETPREREGYNASCTSEQNQCGQSSNGTIDCNGRCTATTPPNPDQDDDGVADCNDNCISISNSNQADANQDGVGDACSPSPTASNLSATTPYQTSLQVQLLCDEPSGMPVNYTILSPEHGSIESAGENVTYTPTPGYSGQDSFSYSCSNGYTESNQAIVAVAVEEQPPAPPAAPSGGSSGGGSWVCESKWVCQEWTACGQDSLQKCLNWTDEKICGRKYDGPMQRACIYTPLTNGSISTGAGNSTNPTVGLNQTAGNETAPPLAEEQPPAGNGFNWQWLLLLLPLGLILFLLRRR